LLNKYKGAKKALIACAPAVCTGQVSSVSHCSTLRLAAFHKQTCIWSKPDL